MWPLLHRLHSVSADISPHHVANGLASKTPDMHVGILVSKA